MKAPSVVVDLGGTHLRAALVSAEGEILRRNQERTPQDEVQPSTLLGLIESVASEAGAKQASIGVPGVVDYVEQSLLTAPNVPQSWIQYLNSDWLSEHSGLAVSMANDADLAAVGEATFGAGKDCRDVVYVTISTGIGAGVVLNGKLLAGRFSGGEIGHSVVDRVRSSQGQDGTVEGLGSGTALSAAAEKAGLDPDGAELTELVRSGDQQAKKVWDSTLGAAAFGIVNLCWIVTPQLVVVGGGVGMNSDLVLPLVRQHVVEYGPSEVPVDVVGAALGDDAALIGGAAWWEAIRRS